MCSPRQVSTGCNEPATAYSETDAWTCRIHCTEALQETRIKCNNVNNQQDATTFSFINLFNSALQVSGDRFAHPQEHFLTVYTALGTTH